MGQVDMLGALGYYKQVKAQLYRVVGKGGDGQSVVLAQLIHGPGGISVIGQHTGDGAVYDVFLGGAIGDHVFVELGQPLIGLFDLAFLGGVGIIAQRDQGHGEQVARTVNAADLASHLRPDQVVVAGDVDGAALGIVHDIDIVHEIGHTVVPVVAKPIGLVDIGVGVGNLLMVQLFQIAALDEGFHIGVAGHDQVIAVTSTGGQLGDGVGVVGHIAPVDGAVVRLLKVGDQGLGDVVAPHEDVQLTAGGGRFVSAAGGLGGSATGTQGQSKCERQDQSQCFFHFVVPS